MIDPGFWRGRRVLVTGHTGFKGSWLALWLQALGAETTGFGGVAPTRPALFAEARVAEGLTHVDGDVRDPGAVAEAVARSTPEVVFHMAAQAIVGRSLRAPVETYAVNVLGTAQVLEALRGAREPPRAVVVVTSDKCYANREWEWGYREDDPLGGRDPYSSSKAAQELVAGAYRDSLGVPVATARAGNVIGGGDWGEDRLVPDLVRAAAAGAPLLVRHPASVRPWQHVLNPLSGYLLLARTLWEDRAAARAYNFGPPDEDARPVRWLVDRLAERWPQPLAVEAASETTGPPEAGTLKLDSSRARAALGWAPRWDLATGLAATVSWYDAHRRGADARALTLGQIASFQANEAVDGG